MNTEKYTRNRRRDSLSLFRMAGIFAVIWGAVQAVLLLCLFFVILREKRYYFFFFFAACLAMVSLYTGYVTIWKRYRAFQKICQLYIEGYITEKEYADSARISVLADAVLKKQTEKLDKIRVLDLSKKQAQYLALQNQINPHFLYNTLEGIRSEALCFGVTSVAGMAEALAMFFRYTISNIDKIVTLEDEVTNVMNYYTIQKYRFEDKLRISVDYGDDTSVLKVRLPKLILQPIVENAVYHGIENKIGNGLVKIKIERTDRRLMIRVSDDGLGMEKAAVEKLNQKLLTNSIEDIVDSEKRKGGIAILNVNNRIKLLYGEEYGVFVYSKKNVGTDVNIVLPLIKE